MLRVPIVVTVIILIAIGAYSTMSLVEARHKLAALDPPVDASRGNYLVTLEFPPERFHQTLLQDMGRVLEVRGDTVYMMDVSATDIRRIAGKYWVESIKRWSGR